MNYFKVKAKCGHVGRGRYIIKDFFIKAESGKDAARIARFLPRVKHDWKDAIISVTAVSKNEYDLGQELHSRDLYFNMTNSSEQRIYGAVDYEQVFDREKPERKKKDKDTSYYCKLARIQQKDFKTRLAEAI
ncbi:MAG: hypothetical protein NC033_00580 [Clostridiales bacterium]|nr:hypothetical protein [Clostridiales bacterium]